jgi:hypothetical protein
MKFVSTKAGRAPDPFFCSPQTAGALKSGTDFKTQLRLAERFELVSALRGMRTWL